MKSLLTIATITLFSMSLFAHGTGPGVTKAKIIELTAHRADRLVTLNKIDSSFLKKLDKIEVVEVANQAPVFYKTRLSQTNPAQGTPLQLDLSFDDDGKPLAFQVIPNGVSGPDMAWTGKSAGELTENALHYVLENSAANAKITPFDKDAISFTLTKGTLNGQAVARGQVLSSSTTEKLNIYLNFDGTFISAEVVP